jgi:hypothetical protein
MGKAMLFSLIYVSDFGYAQPSMLNHFRIKSCRGSDVCEPEGPLGLKRIRRRTGRKWHSGLDHAHAVLGDNVSSGKSSVT